MDKIKNLSILFVFLVIYCNFNINGYVVENLTPYHPFSRFSTSSNCTFTFNILCVTTSITESCNVLSFSNNQPYNYNITTLIKNGTASIFQVSYNNPPSNFISTINSELIINLNCYDISVNDIDFIPHNSKGYYSPAPFGTYLQYSRIYELVGVAPLAPLNEIKGTCKGLPSSICSFQFLSGNKFLFSTIFDFKYNYSFIMVSVTIKNILKDFSFEPVYQDSYDYIYDVKIYPDSQYLFGLQLNGYGEAPVLSFKSNNTVYKSSFVINIDGYFSQYSQYNPVYGDENSTTYFYSLSNYYIKNFYDIYYQSGKNLKHVDQIVETMVFNFDYVSIPSDGKFQMDSISATLYSFQFNDSKRCPLPPIVVYVSLNQVITKFPLGYSFGNLYGYQFNYTIPTKLYSYFNDEMGVYSYVDNSGSYAYYQNDGYVISNLPSLYRIESIHLEYDLFLYRVYAKTPYKFGYIGIDEDISFGFETFISGDFYNGIYEIVQESTFSFDFYLYDIYDGLSLAKKEHVIGINPPQIYIPCNYIFNFDIFSIQNVSFLYNDIDVTNHRQYNIISFNYSNIPRDSVISMIPLDMSYYSPLKDLGSYLKYPLFKSKYNQSIEMFQIEFYIDANTQIGNYPFLIVANGTFLSSEALEIQLRVVKSKMDLLGPIFNSINKLVSPQINKSNPKGQIGWSLGIEDPINGFDNGYITIVGDTDQSVYNISVNSNGDKKEGDIYSGIYDVVFNVSYPCITQNYTISEILLFDRLQRKSYFSLYPSDSELVYNYGTVNPFLNFLNDTLINRILLECSNDPVASVDITPPELISFSMSNTTIDVSKTNREITFKFSARDLESGLKNKQYPIVYITAFNLRVLECKSSIVEFTSTIANYSCTIQLPLSYGYPSDNINGILLSVYGFINNNGLFSGFSTAHLMDLGFSYKFNVTFDSFEPSLTSYYPITHRGGNLWLYGRGFNSSSIAYIKYGDGTFSIIGATSIYSTIISIPNIKSINQPFELYIKTGTLKSNNLIVEPIQYEFYIDQTTNKTISPISTNSPKKCPGEPVCGGLSNGNCIENNGCVCIAPWVGSDCLSKIILIEQPTINQSSPSTEINIFGNNSNGNASNSSSVPNSSIAYRSLISIVSLREIDINGKEVLNIPFNDWSINQFDNDIHLYNTTLLVNKNNIQTTTKVSVTLQWFKNETKLTFANQNLIMNPSTIKYTIEIGNYQFDNKLNQLQLVISSSIQSNSNDDNVCSSKQFGQTPENDSDYLKIQVNDHSLYGRFIKRAIIDSKVISVSNIILDSNYNPIIESKSLQSYIGIQIPYFYDSVILDPDYTVLIESNSASSICSNDKSKLSTSKLIGIVIGSAALFAIVVISSIYVIIKKRKQKKFILGIGQKMKQMDSNN